MRLIRPDQPDFANVATLPDPAPEANGTPEAEDTEESSGRRMDPELRTIASILRQIEELEEPARGRVMAYLYSRYRQQSSE